MKALILFMCSSGCAIQEATNLTMNDYLKSIEDYTNNTPIQTTGTAGHNRKVSLGTTFNEEQKHIEEMKREAELEKINYA